jgi:hypothetical protein
MDGLDSRGFDGQNGSATSRVTSGIRIISTHDLRVCGAFVSRFVSPLQGDGRAGWPFTQGGAPRLPPRRSALG